MNNLIEIQIGDRVELTTDYPDRNEELVSGCRGTVCAVPDGDGDFMYGVEWDNLTNGHDCGYRCRDSHGWYVDAVDIRLLEENPGQECVAFQNSELQSLLF